MKNIIIIFNILIQLLSLISSIQCVHIFKIQTNTSSHDDQFDWHHDMFPIHSSSSSLYPSTSSPPSSSLLHNPSWTPSFSWVRKLHSAISSTTTTTTTSTTTTPSPMSLGSNIYKDSKDLTIKVPLFKVSLYKTSRSGGCPSLRNSLPNGYVKISSRGTARFYCDPGYILVGSKNSVCRDGKWNSEFPICVSTICRVKINPQRPLVVKKNFKHGSVLDLSCELGYDLRIHSQPTASMLTTSGITLAGRQTSIRIYCVGKQWLMDEDWSIQHDGDGVYYYNRVPLTTLPECEIHETYDKKSKNCDFEDSLCGWYQDTEDDFDWTRYQDTTPSHDDNTGPSFDHTLGKDKNGYYLYIESSYPRSPFDMARLYSPVFQHLEESSVACFQFYYHMYGKTIGYLKVYIKERSQTLMELLPVWEVAGDQGNQWLIGQVEIRPSSDTVPQPFQIIIEGVVGFSHQGDIAIDDLSLTLGKNCSSISQDSMNVITEPNISDLDSSKDYDNNNNNNNSSSILPLPEGLSSNSTNDSVSIVRSVFRLPSETATITNNVMDTSTTTTTIPTTIQNIYSTTITPISIISSSTTIKDQVPSLLNKTHQEKFQDILRKHNFTIINKNEELDQSIISTPMANRLLSINNNNIGNNEKEEETRIKLKYSMHWIFIMLATIAFLILISITIYMVYINWPIYNHLIAPIEVGGGGTGTGTGFVAVFVNRCKLFQRTTNNQHDDSEMLMVNDENQQQHQQHPYSNINLSSNNNNNNNTTINHYNEPFYDNNNLLEDDAVYLQRHNS